MFKAGRDLAFGRTVRAQLVRDDPFGQAKPLDQGFQKTLCGTLVALRLQDFLQNDPLLINRAPEPESEIVTTTLSRCQTSPGGACRRRKFRAICGANFATQRRIVS